MTKAERFAALRAERRARLFSAAFRAAEKFGYRNITRSDVAILAGVCPGTVNTEFGTMAGMREALIREAIARGNLKVLAQGLAYDDPIAKGAPPALRAAAADTLI